MSNKKSTVFVVEEQMYQFDFGSFKRYFDGYRKMKKKKVGELELQLADEIGLSKETIHGWRCRKHGPSDLEMIKKLAELLQVKDWQVMLKAVDDGGNNMGLNDKQKESLKRVYDAIMDFLFEFERTDGFNDYWSDYVALGVKDVEEKLIEVVDEKIAAIDLVLNKEYFYLGEHRVFEELAEYVGDTLNSIVDGKLSYAYRFEVVPDEQPSTMEDYDMAMRTILTIIDKYK